MGERRGGVEGGASAGPGCGGSEELGLLGGTLEETLELHQLAPIDHLNILVIISVDYV